MSAARRRKKAEAKLDRAHRRYVLELLGDPERPTDDAGARKDCLCERCVACRVDERMKEATR